MCGLWNGRMMVWWKPPAFPPEMPIEVREMILDQMRDAYLMRVRG